MKNISTGRRAGSIVCVLFLGMAILLCGCSLAREDIRKVNGKDRLIGVYITREHLRLDQDRAYGIMEKQKGQGAGEFVFEGVEGIPFFMPLVKLESGSEGDVAITQQGPEIADGHFASGDLLKLEGVIYYSGEDSPQFYCNPVYQGPDGSVFMKAGTGISGPTSNGLSFSMKLSETHTVSVQDGQPGQGENAADGQVRLEEGSSEVNITIQGKAEWEKCMILQMDENNQIIKKTAGEDARASGVLEVEEKTAYIIVEGYTKEDKKTEREFFDLGEEENYISIYTQAPDGIVLKEEIRTQSR